MRVSKQVGKAIEQGPFMLLKSVPDQWAGTTAKATMPVQSVIPWIKVQDEQCVAISHDTTTTIGTLINICKEGCQFNS